MCGKVGQDRSSSPVSVTSSTFEEVGEESIGSAFCLDLRARPGGADILGGAAVSRVLSPDGEAPTASIAAAGPARSCEGCPLNGGAAVSRGLSPGGEAPTASVAGASGQHAVERAALSVERVLMALAQKARPCLKPHHPSRLPTDAPAPGHQCAAAVGEKEGAPWSSALPHPPQEYGLSQRSACAFSSFVVDQACSPTSTSSPLSRDGSAHPCADLGPWEPSVWDLSLKARSLLTGRSWPL